MNPMFKPKLIAGNSVQLARGGVHVQHIAIEIFNKHGIRRTRK